MVKTKRIKREILNVDCENKDVELKLKSVPDFDAPGSSQDHDIRKISTPILKRRDAIDNLNAINSTPACSVRKVSRHVRSENSESSEDSEFESSNEEEELKTKTIGTQTETSVNVNDLVSLTNVINAELTSCKRSILYNIKRLDNKLELHIVSQNNAINLGDILTKLDIKEPINELESFNDFNKKLKTDQESAKCLEQLFVFKCRTNTIQEAVGSVLSTIMTQDLQMKFSGCDKPNKGARKENFSRTELYLKIKEYLLLQFVNENEKTMLSKTSRWLSSAPDRCGGRYNR